MLPDYSYLSPFCIFLDISKSMRMVDLPSQGSTMITSTLNLTLHYPYIMTYHTCPTYTGILEVCSSVTKSGSHIQPRFTLRTVVKDWSVFWALYFCVVGEQSQSWTTVSIRHSKVEQFMLKPLFNQFSSVEDEKEKKKKVDLRQSFTKASLLSCLLTFTYIFCANVGADLQY